MGVQIVVIFVKLLLVNSLSLVHRCNLASVVLQLLAMGISNVAGFDFMDKPSPEVGCSFC